MTSFGVAIDRAMSFATSTPSIGLTSSPSTWASSMNARSRHMVMKASPNARARSAGRPGGAANGRAMKKGSSANSINAALSESVASSRPVGMSGNSFETRAAAELQQRPESLPVPQIALPAPDRAQPDHLPVQFPTLHGKEYRRSSRVATHDVHVQAENLARDKTEDEVG